VGGKKFARGHRPGKKVEDKRNTPNRKGGPPQTEEKVGTQKEGEKVAGTVPESPKKQPKKTKGPARPAENPGGGNPSKKTQLRAKTEVRTRLWQGWVLAR